MNLENTVKVDRREHLSVREFKDEYQNRLRPVIITDACRHWSAFGKWSPEYFRKNFGEVPVEIDGNIMSFKQFIDSVEASTEENPSRYLREFYPAKSIPALMPDIQGIPGNDDNWLNSRLMIAPWRIYLNGAPELLIAGRGVRFPVLHFDAMHMHAFITQIQGDKHFWLFPPDHTRFVYPKQSNPNLSSIDGFDPVDFERFPLFREAQPLEVDLRSGETIFVPSGWWHRTQILSTSIAVTWNSVSRANWSNYASYFYMPHSKQKPMRTALKKTYLETIGAMMRVGEKISADRGRQEFF